MQQVRDILKLLCKKVCKSYTMPADCKCDKVGQLAADKTKLIYVAQQVSMIDGNEGSKWHSMVFIFFNVYNCVFIQPLFD